LSGVADLPDNACPLSTIVMTDRLRISRRMLAICLLASVAVHGLLLTFVPGWRVSVPAPALEMPMLDVVMVASEPPAAASPPKSAAPSVRAASPSIPAKPVPRQTVPVIEQEAAAPPVAPAPNLATATASAAAPRSVESSPSPAATASAPLVSPIAKAPPPVITPPAFNAAYLRNPPPAYPAVARRNGEEGTVLLRVLVGRDGMPLKVEVDQSSRSRALDRAALDAVKDWRFVPARRGVESIEAWVRVPVSFRLES
jgi:periplasmic protein TonB